MAASAWSCIATGREYWKSAALTGILRIRTASG